MVVAPGRSRWDGEGSLDPTPTPGRSSGVRGRSVVRWGLAGREWRRVPGAAGVVQGVVGLSRGGSAVTGPSSETRRLRDSSTPPQSPVHLVVSPPS